MTRRALDQAGVFIVSGSGSVLAGPMPEEQARLELESAAQAKGAKRVAGSVAMTSSPEIAAAKFGGAAIRKVGDSIEFIQRIDMGLGRIEVVDRHTFENSVEVRIDRVLAVKDPITGFLRVDARLTRVGVFRYSDRAGNVWGELRDESEVFEPGSMRSFEMVVLTDDHPSEFVTTRNVDAVQIGHVGSDVRRDGIYLRASILITDAVTIAKVEAGKCELSCGYTATGVIESGRRDGLDYKIRQRNVRGNHVSIVDMGRAGPECRILIDCAFTDWSHEMKRKIMIDGVEMELPAEVADAIEASRKDKVREVEVGGIKVFAPIADADKIDAMVFGEPDEEEEAKDAASKVKAKAKAKPKADTRAMDPDVAQGKIDSLTSQLDSMREGSDFRVDARVQLLDHARTILGPEFKTDGKSNVVIKSAIVLKVQPGMKAKLDQNKSEGYLDGLFEGALVIHDQAESAALENSTAIFDGIRGAQGETEDSIDPIKAYGAYLDSHRNGWKRPRPDAAKEGN
jgi:hypothetical protein